MKSLNVNQSFERLESRLLMAVHAVLNNDDTGAGSLRQAIADAVSGDTIDLSGLTGNIVFTSEIAIATTELTISGAGADVLSLDGNDVTRIFNVAADGVLTLQGLTLTRGFAERGGAIANEGQLTLDRVTVTANRATRFGGGIYQT
ncbi:MAG: hypothetical protein M3478_04305, partial [Planctomycetota bacterium]|nr:hypothetical protein [Planctomycetota bacterium]